MQFMQKYVQHVLPEICTSEAGVELIIRYPDGVSSMGAGTFVVGIDTWCTVLAA